MRRIASLALTGVLGAVFTPTPAGAASLNAADGSGAGSAVLQLLERLIAPIFGDTQLGGPGNGAAGAASVAPDRGSEQDSGAQSDPDG